MNRIPSQYCYYNNTEEQWFAEIMQTTNESSSGSGELYSKFTTPAYPNEQTEWYDGIHQFIDDMIGIDF